LSWTVQGALLFSFSPMPPVLDPNGSPLAPGTIYAIGRNYAAHAMELGNPTPTSPLFFLKAASSLAGPGALIPLPSGASSLDYEVELVVLIAQDTGPIASEEALNIVGGWAVGVDFTDRARQSVLKANGHPWAAAKSFRGAAACSHFIKTEALSDPQNVTLTLTVNDEPRQAGNTAQMSHSVANLIAFLSIRQDLRAGDLIYTGTPAGVGPLTSGDRVDVHLDTLISAQFTVGD